MRKFIFLTPFICMTCNLVHAQPNIDSLFRVLNSSPDDTTRIMTLSRLAEGVRRNNPDTALLCLEEAIKLAEKLNFKKGWAAALNTKGYLLSGKSEFEESERLHLKALQFSQEINNDGEIARSYTGLGQIAQIKGEYHSSGDNFRQALQYNLKGGTQRALAGSYTNVAAAFGALSKYDSCIFYQLKSVGILESLGDRGALGRAYANVGAIYVDKENYPEALKYLELALKNSREAGDKMHQSHILSVMGGIYINQKKYDEANRCVKESMQLGEETGRKIYVARGLRAIGKIAEDKGLYTEAMKNYEQARLIIEDMGTSIDIIEINTFLARVLNKQGKPADALRYLKQSLAVPSVNESKAQLFIIYEELHKTYSQLNDYKQAYHYLQLYGAIKDSVDNKEQTQIVEDLKLQYETEKKDQQISLLNLQNQNKERQRNSLILVSVLLGISLVTLFFVFRQRMQISKLKEAERSRKQLQLLRNDIAQDLHDDIGSTLSSISYYSEAIRQQVKTSTPQVIPLLEKMEKASGYTVNAMSDIVWAINATHDTGINLLNRMQAYATEICGIKNIDLLFNADKSFEDAKLKMSERKNFYLIFKEAVNNAVKYSGCKKISVNVIRENNRIFIKINDDGNGFETNGEYTGNGLKNMQSRADEIKAKLLITSTAGKGTSVTLEL